MSLHCTLYAHRHDGTAGIVCHYTLPDQEALDRDLPRWRAIYPGCWIEAVEQPETETVTLLDGPAAQHLVPGVAPVPNATRQIAQERARRAGRRGDAPLPCGGLWDDVARAQQDLFV